MVKKISSHIPTDCLVYPLGCTHPSLDTMVLDLSSVTAVSFPKPRLSSCNLQVTINDNGFLH